MNETDFDRMVRRAESLYGHREEQPRIPAVYVVEPPQMPRHSEIDEARALVVAFLRELPELMLLAAALAVVGLRRCWLWLRQWKRTPQIGGSLTNTIFKKAVGVLRQ
jgi:hypothetical protein